MALDENPYAEPEWMRLARLTDAENKAHREADQLDRDECEAYMDSPEYQRNLLAARPDWMAEIEYGYDPAWLPR
jgi:hypothetical protein